MTISRFYNREAEIRRYAYVDGVTQDSEGDTFACHIQQASPEETEQIGMRFTEAYKMWCPLNTDIQKGDDVICENSLYKVGGIMERNYGKNQHLEVFMEYKGYES